MGAISTKPKDGAAEPAKRERNNYLTQQETAAYLRLSPRTLERHRVAGSGPPFAKLGRRVVYSQLSLDDWVAARTFQSTSEADQRRP